LLSAKFKVKKMKYLILLLLPILVFSNEHRVLLSGFTIHEHSNDRFNEKYNALNYGLGYEYNFFQEYNKLYFGGNILVLNDSFENPQYTIGFGHYYRFDTGMIDTAIGLSGFIGYKKIYTDDDLGREDGKYKFTGGVGPSVHLYKNNFSINFMYIPSIKYKDFDLTGFLYTYFSYKF